jgi:hypothetical protein
MPVLVGELGENIQITHLTKVGNRSLFRLREGCNKVSYPLLKSY